MKIRTKISLVFLGTFIVVMIIIGVVMQIASIRIIENEVNRHLETTSQSRAQAISWGLEAQLDKIKVAATHSELSIEELKEIKDINKEFQEVFVLDSNGIIITSSDESQIGKDKSTDDYFINGKEKAHIKDAYFSETLGEDSIAFSTPHAGGVLVARVDLDVFEEVTLNITGLKETGESYLINKDKYMITPSRFTPEEETFLKQKVDTLGAKHCFETHLQESHIRAEIYKDYRGVEVLGSYLHIPQTNWCLLVEINKKEAFSSTLNILYTFLGLSGALLIVYYLLSVLLARTITKPIEILHKGSQVIKKGNLDYKVGTSDKDEIGQLSRAFDSMTLGIKKSRAEIDKKVKEQTQEIVKKQKLLEDQQKALTNVLEDIEEEKNRATLEKDKIDAILHSIGDGVFVVDKNYKITMFNQVASTISGFSSEEAIGKNYKKILKFVYEKDNKTINDEFIKKAMTTNKVQEMSNHTVLIRKDGNGVAVADSAAPLNDSNNNVIGCVVVFRDVTKEREVDKMKTEFVSIASHQLRTPLTAIKWIIELFLEDKDITPKQKERLNDIYSSNQQLIDLVGDLLNISRIETGRLIIKKKIVNIKDLIDNSIKVLKPNAIKKKQKINLNVKIDIKESNIDPTLFSTVFNNLLSNAIAYAPDNSSVDVLITEKAKDYSIEVHNKGPAIIGEDRKKIFTKFWRGAEAQRMRARGTGLGLFIAKSAVEANGGSIWFESEKDKGTSFYFTVPHK